MEENSNNMVVEQKSSFKSNLNKPMSTNMKTLLAAIWFVLIFGTLLTLASFFDLEISKILTKGSLPAGEYFSTNQFGLFFEAIGSAPIWIIGAIAATIMLWNAERRCKKGLGTTLAVLLGIGVVFILYMFFTDIFKYVLEKVDAKAYGNEIYVVLLKVVIAASTGGMLIALWKNIKPETNETLMKWALVILCVAVFYILVSVLKGPIGRARFRAMSWLGDTNNNMFTNWWVINGARSIDSLPSDAFKSFPSGHTFSAGVIYTLVCLPALIPCLDKTWKKVLIWVGCIGFTGVVAISRIVVGAHYFSDVLFGGTIAFMATILFREIFVNKCMHFKALGELSKNRKVKNMAPTEEEKEESIAIAKAEKEEKKEIAKEAKVETKQSVVKAIKAETAKPVESEAETAKAPAKTTAKAPAKTTAKAPAKAPAKTTAKAPAKTAVKASAKPPVKKD